MEEWNLEPFEYEYTDNDYRVCSSIKSFYQLKINDIFLQNLRNIKAFSNYIKPKLLQIQSRISISRALTIISAMWREFSTSSNFTAYSNDDEVLDEEANILVRPSARAPMVTLDLLPSEKQTRSTIFFF